MKSKSLKLLQENTDKLNKLWHIHVSELQIHTSISSNLKSIMYEKGKLQKVDTAKQYIWQN